MKKALRNWKDWKQSKIKADAIVMIDFVFISLKSWFILIFCLIEKLKYCTTKSESWFRGFERFADSILCETVIWVTYHLILMFSRHLLEVIEDKCGRWKAASSHKNSFWWLNIILLHVFIGLAGFHGSNIFPVAYMSISSFFFHSRIFELLFWKAEFHSILKSTMIMWNRFCFLFMVVEMVGGLCWINSHFEIPENSRVSGEWFKTNSIVWRLIWLIFICLFLYYFFRIVIFHYNHYT